MIEIVPILVQFMKHRRNIHTLAADLWNEKKENINIFIGHGKIDFLSK